MRRRPLASPLALVSLLLALGLQGCYVTEEGSHYLAILARAKPVAGLLKDPRLPPKERAFLEAVADIRAFGIGKLGLKDTKNYTSLAEVEGGTLAHVVQACAELSFDRHLWSYPLVGKLPYKGFFTEAEARAEADRLKAQGLDTLVRDVDAFSTLGWLRDPLLSFMEDYPRADLADLLLHEMTHATAFSKAPGDFNEEVATFVGRRGAEAYLADREGPDSPDLAEARAGRARAETFSAFLRATAQELEALYGTTLPEGEKRDRKAAILARRAAEYRNEGVALFGADPAAQGYRDFDMGKVNNAYLDLYRLYEGEPALYEDYCRKVCGDDLARFIREARRLAALRDPKGTMRAELAAAGG